MSNASQDAGAPNATGDPTTRHPDPPRRHGLFRSTGQRCAKIPSLIGRPIVVGGTFRPRRRHIRHLRIRARRTRRHCPPLRAWRTCAPQLPFILGNHRSFLLALPHQVMGILATITSGARKCNQDSLCLVVTVGDDQ